MNERCPKCGQKKRRSNPANARYWLILHIAADKLHPEGKTYTAENFHAYYKSRFLGCDEMPMPNGRVLIIPKPSHDLDTEAFNDYVGRVEADLAERGVYLDSLED